MPTRTPRYPRMPLKRARRAKNAIRLAPMFKANMTAVDAPEEAASITFLSSLNKKQNTKAEES